MFVVDSMGMRMKSYVLMQGVMCSGVTYYIQGVVMKIKGPVFVTAFNPLSLILVAILSSFILSEIMFLGR